MQRENRLFNVNWRYLVKPEILLFVGMVQANLPYLLWFLGYPIIQGYHFNITYQPLLLWILGYAAFCLGTGYVSICLSRKVRRRGDSFPFQIRQRVFHTLVLFTIFVVIIQIIQACLLYGTLPIWGYLSGGYDVQTLNTAQEVSGFGQLGSKTLMLFILNSLILIGIVSNFRAKGWDRKILWLAIIIAVFGSLFSGKTQGFFICVCILFTGAALTGANPINMFVKKIGFREISNKKTVITMICLLLFLVLLHGFTRSIRTSNHQKFGIRDSFGSVVNYLSLPLINMENQLAISGLSGSRSEFSGLLTGLVPYKIQSHFAQSVSPVPRLERSSPSGILSTPHWYLGLWGMLIFMFIIGAVCKYFYVKSRRSLFCLLAYSQIAWALVAAHAYNHFLYLLFIPAPLIMFFVICKIVQLKQVKIWDVSTARTL